ncbi:MAG TPA: ThuA domain-containing protein [Blastocatellia bacterium]|nr:ThuA domain-containing protein [Blastocatellia bacterium]
MSLSSRVYSIGVWLIIVWTLTTAVGQTTSPQQAPWRPPPKRSDALKVQVVTGGHDYDASFYSLFEGYDDLDARVNPHPSAFGGDLRRRAEVLVLYDHIRSLQPKQREHLQAFVESGKGVVILHHAICDSVDWPWWYEEVAGGRWLFEPFEGKPATTYRHDEDILVRPVGAHPITRGLRPFRIWDETYKGLWISPKVKVVLETDHANSDGPLAWISPYPKSRVIYLQLGHDRNAHLNPEYRGLVRNAILWSAGRLN